MKTILNFAIVIYYSKLQQDVFRWSKDIFCIIFFRQDFFYLKIKKILPEKLVLVYRNLNLSFKWNNLLLINISRYCSKTIAALITE